MERIIISSIAIILSLEAYAQFSGQGNGTEKDPYLVSNADELFEVRNDLNAYYKQVCDIDLTEWIMEDNPRLGWAPIGSAATPFAGVYDGDGFKIIGLYINRDNINNVGLFGCINQAEIKNLNIINANVRGGNNVGILVGLSGFNNFHSRLHYDNLISNIIIVGSTLYGYYNVGGVVGNICNLDFNLGGNGYYWLSAISGCYANVDINGQGECVGGICGNVISGRYYYYRSEYTNGYGDSYGVGIYDNMFYGNVSGTLYVGGIVGYSTGLEWYDDGFFYSLYPKYTFANNISAGNVCGDDYVCGILGRYGYSYTNSCISKDLRNNFAVCDTISSTFSAYRVTHEQYPNNFAYNGTVAMIGNKPSYFDDNELNGVGYGLKNLMKKTTYDGASFDMLNNWSIVEGESLPFMKTQSKPAKVTSFYSGSKATISGIAEGVGKVFVLKGNTLYTTDVIDGEWTVNIGNFQENGSVKVYCSCDGLMTSIPTHAIAEAPPIVEPDVILGDSNADGVVDAADVVGTINYILGKPSSSFNNKNADVNGDDQILVDDAVGTVNIIMSNQ